MKKLISTLLAGGMLLGVIGAAQAAPAVVVTDASGDATLESQLPASVPGGWDITEGAIERDGANINFTVTHGDMPPFGSMPEATRFIWNFNVGKNPFRLTVKSADLGKPDVVGGQTDERVGRADVAGHFRLEGKCETDASLPLQRVNCPVIGYFEGAFDPASMSFTATIPMTALKAKPGVAIGPAAEQICTVCWVTQVAERSLNVTVIDEAQMLKSYKIPK